MRQSNALSIVKTVATATTKAAPNKTDLRAGAGYILALAAYVGQVGAHGFRIMEGQVQLFPDPATAGGDGFYYPVGGEVLPVLLMPEGDPPALVLEQINSAGADSVGVVNLVFGGEPPEYALAALIERMRGDIDGLSGALAGFQKDLMDHLIVERSAVR